MDKSIKNRIDEARVPAAEQLQRAASAIQDRADSLPGGPRVSSVVGKAAGGMQTAAQYLSEHDLDAIGSDVRTTVRKYPVQSIIAGAVLGFLIGRRFRPSA